MPLFLSLSTAAHEYWIEILGIFRLFSEGINIVFRQKQYNRVINQAWRQTFGMHSAKNAFRKMTDNAKDIIWFMYYDCDESSQLCGIWCGQSYLDACKTIYCNVDELNENNLPILSWSCCNCGSLLTNLKDINFKMFYRSRSSFTIF